MNQTDQPDDSVDKLSDRKIPQNYFCDFSLNMSADELVSTNSYMVVYRFFADMGSEEIEVLMTDDQNIETHYGNQYLKDHAQMFNNGEDHREFGLNSSIIVLNVSDSITKVDVFTRNIEDVSSGTFKIGIYQNVLPEIVPSLTPSDSSNSNSSSSKPNGGFTPTPDSTPKTPKPQNPML